MQFELVWVARTSKGIRLLPRRLVRSLNTDRNHSALEVLLKEHGSGVTDSRQCGSTGANRDRDAQSLYRQRRKKRPVSSRACRSAAWESPMRSPTPLFSLPPTRRPLLPATCFPSMAGSRRNRQHRPTASRETRRSPVSKRVNSSRAPDDDPTLIERISVQ